MTRLVRNDAAVPALQPPDRGWEIRDERDRLLGLVAGSGRSWSSGRIGPTRSRPIVPVAWAPTRKAAVDRLVRGRP
jgi:hypothetical protein